MLKVMAFSVAMVVLVAGVTIAQVTSPSIEIDKFTCAELLAFKGRERATFLIYLNGYVNGSRSQKVWNKQAEGQRIDQAERECKAAPTRLALDVFTSVWSR